MNQFIWWNKYPQCFLEYALGSFPHVTQKYDERWENLLVQHLVCDSKEIVRRDLLDRSYVAVAALQKACVTANKRDNFQKSKRALRN